MTGIDVVFHLAADHGGRGYVDLHQAACASNLALDGMLFNAACDAGVEKVVFASSGCVYPNFRSEDPDEELYLTEEMVGPPYDADNMYGWAKLMAEMTLAHLRGERGLKAASLPLLHRLRRARQGGPRRHRDDRARVRQAGPVRGLGRPASRSATGPTSATSSRARSWPPSGSTTAPRSTSERWSGRA